MRMRFVPALRPRLLLERMATQSAGCSACHCGPGAAGRRGRAAPRCPCADDRWWIGYAMFASRSHTHADTRLLPSALHRGRRDCARRRVQRLHGVFRGVWFQIVVAGACPWPTLSPRGHGGGMASVTNPRASATVADYARSELTDHIRTCCSRPGLRLRLMYHGHSRETPGRTTTTSPRNGWGRAPIPAEARFERVTRESSRRISGHRPASLEAEAISSHARQRVTVIERRRLITSTGSGRVTR